MEKITVALIVRNEERAIAQCLQTVKWADEIMVIDQSSTDATVKIVKGYTDKIFIRPEQRTANVDRMFAVEKARCEWMLFLDADERVPTELRDEIMTILANPEYNAYYIGRKNFFLGKWIKYGGWYPAYSIKLFKKGFVYFPPRVHKDGYTKYKAGYLKEKALHYSYGALSQYIDKFNRFTTRQAKEEFEAGRRINLVNFFIYFILKPVFYFLRKYFLWQGFRDGIRGFFIALFSAMTIFMVGAKIWELQNNSTPK